MTPVFSSAYGCKREELWRCSQKQSTFQVVFVPMTSEPLSVLIYHCSATVIAHMPGQGGLCYIFNLGAPLSVDFSPTKGNEHSNSHERGKCGWAWWFTPVIPATWEAEAGESLEPRRQRLWWAEIAPLHSRLGNKSETLSQKNKTKQNSY